MKIIKAITSKLCPTIKVGSYELKIHKNNPHEKRYLSDYLVADYFIAKQFVNKGNNVLDIGANIGLTSLFYIELGASEVHAIEPIQELFNRINKIQCPRIITHHCAISDYCGTGEIIISKAHNQGHSLNPDWPTIFSNVFTGKQKKEVIQVTTLDELYPDKTFDFIKIDVEGVEDKLVRGGVHFWKRHYNATLQVEIYDPLFIATDKLLKSYYKNVLRVGFNNINKLICTCLPDEIYKNEQYSFSPPMYLYFN